MALRLGDRGAVSGSRATARRSRASPVVPQWSHYRNSVMAHSDPIGIGGHLATPPLPHHRAYGSVPRRFGGFGFDEVRHGDQAHGTKAALAERLMQGAGRTQTPRSLRAIGRLEGRLPGNPEMTQPSDTSAH